MLLFELNCFMNYLMKQLSFLVEQNEKPSMQIGVHLCLSAAAPCVVGSPQNTHAYIHKIKKTGIF